MIDEKYVAELVCREVVDAKKKHGETFSSDYEYLGALRCEIAETKEHMDNIQAFEIHDWVYLKVNHELERKYICRMYREAIQMIREATQIAAICHKRIDWSEYWRDEK